MYSCWKWSLNVIQYKRGQFVGNHGLSYTITNLTMVAIWRSNGFRIHPLIAEKKTTLLFQGTFGHTVVVEKVFCFQLLRRQVISVLPKKSWAKTWCIKVEWLTSFPLVSPRSNHSTVTDLVSGLMPDTTAEWIRPAEGERKSVWEWGTIWRGMNPIMGPSINDIHTEEGMGVAYYFTDHGDH